MYLTPSFNVLFKTLLTVRLDFYQGTHAIFKTSVVLKIFAQIKRLEFSDYTRGL